MFVLWTPGNPRYNAWSWKCWHCSFKNLSWYWLDQFTKNTAKRFSLTRLTKRKTEFLQEFFLFSWQNFISGSIFSLTEWLLPRECHWGDGFHAVLHKPVCFNLRTRRGAKRWHRRDLCQLCCRCIPIFTEIPTNLWNIVYDKQLAYTCKLSTRREWFSLVLSICVKGKNYGCCCTLQNGPRFSTGPFPNE